MRLRAPVRRSGLAGALAAAPLVAMLAFAARPAAAAAFPDITPEELALKTVPGAPNAAAVTLFRKAAFRIGDGMDGESSTFLVRVRRKILSEQGKRYGETVVHHSNYWRLKSFEGRTVLPGGKVVPLPNDAVFRRQVSKSDKIFETVVAFPAVEVGAILDFQYEIKIDSIFMLEPWVLQEEVPVLYSEIVYEVPTAISAATWMSDPMKLGLKTEQTKTLKGTTLKVWGKDLPDVPSEPFGLPFADMASRFMLVPTRVAGGADLFKSWASTCDLFGSFYDASLARGRAAEAKAKTLAGTGTKAEKARTLYRFVRDQIKTDDGVGVFVGDGSTVDTTLNASHGSGIEKALLLIEMLRAVKIDAQPVWVAYRSSGRIDLSLPNPQWFEQTIVAAKIDDRWIFLAPFDRDLAYGALPPGFEGTAALLFDRKKPEPIILPETPFEGNARRARLELTVGDDGRVTGQGTLTLTGHHAWESSHQEEGAAKALESWQDWLTKRFPGYAVAEVKVDEKLDERKIDLSWTLAERPEEVLGDEVTLRPNRPFGPVTQPFASPVRRSAVLLDYADRDEQELVVHWPKGFKLDARPADVERQSAAGALSAKLEVQEGSLTYRRRFDLPQKNYNSKALFDDLKALYAEAEKNDVQTLVLVRR